ncbi:hypothetical protein G6011_03587 [Alternaria panax]|uniref:Uncharacterized protein n=1 Tax=Alternaria panax TaxID=48097 RepID=A0AAD4NT12_9PLEO|nr:hypothetical protein G6011_03587 [Alternaria panax]
MSSFKTRRSPHRGAPTNPTDIAQAENDDGYFSTTETGDDILELDWIEAEDLQFVKLASKETAALEESRRSAAEAERRRTIDAQQRSAHEAFACDQEDFLQAVWKSRKEECSRAARAAREKEQQAIVERRVAAKLKQKQNEAEKKFIAESKATEELESEGRRKAGELALLQAEYAVAGLSEDEQMKLGMLLS